MLKKIFPTILSEIQINLISLPTQLNNMFSKACEYGIKAIIFIAAESLQNRRVKMSDIVNKVGSPEAFTAKILSKLVKAGIVESLKGPVGGFQISPMRMPTIMVNEVVYAIDGDAIYNGCGLGLDECSSLQPCPMHDRFSVIRQELKQMLQTTSVHELAIGVKSGKTLLMR